MEKEIVDNIMYEVNELARSKDFTNAKIEYVLVNKQNTKHSIAVINDQNNELYEVTLKDNEINPALDWAYNIDDDVFAHLENEYEIGFMSLEFHSGIWYQVEDIGIEEFTHKLGLQKYLKYCKDNGIDKKTICEKLNTDLADIMQYYNEKTDYIKIENGQVQLPQEKYQKESEISYIAFCLGYDLLNDKLSESEKNECDNVYDFCNYLANKFIETDYYKNAWRSTYDSLSEWLEDNREIIQSEYLCYLGKDNKCILETGKRNNDKVALVEHQFKDGTKEYIVAFHYEVDDKKVNWGYGYYYGDDLKKAKEDFEKVIDTNLVGTFNMTRNVIPQMVKQKSGRIISISSVVGVAGNAGQTNYSASKAGIIGFTKSLAKEVASRGILVNAVAPGFIETDMTDILKDEIKDEITKNIPLKRVGTAKDVANVVKFLASEDSSYITGQVINVDGGMVM